MKNLEIGTFDPKSATFQTRIASSFKAVILQEPYRDVDIPVIPGVPRDQRDVNIPGVPGDPRDPRDPRDIPPGL